MRLHGNLVPHQSVSAPLRETIGAVNIVIIVIHTGSRVGCRSGEACPPPRSGQHHSGRVSGHDARRLGTGRFGQEHALFLLLQARCQQLSHPGERKGEKKRDRNLVLDLSEWTVEHQTSSSPKLCCAASFCVCGVNHPCHSFVRACVCT